MMYLLYPTLQKKTIKKLTGHLIDGLGDMTPEDMAPIHGGLLGLAVGPGEGEARGHGGAGRAASVERYAVD